MESKLEASVAELLKQQDIAKVLKTQLAESESKQSELKAELKSSQSKVSDFVCLQFVRYEKKRVQRFQHFHP